MTPKSLAAAELASNFVPVTKAGKYFVKVGDKLVNVSKKSYDKIVDTLKRIEVKVDSSTLGMNGGNIKVGLKNLEKTPSQIKTDKNLEKASALKDKKTLGSRKEAFNQAKRDAGIPTSQQPYKTELVDYEVKGDKVFNEKTGKYLQTKQYYFKNKDGKDIMIQDHVAGHKFGDKPLGENIGDQKAHFNVRPAGKPKASVEGTKDHYTFKSNSSKEYLK